MKKGKSVTTNTINRLCEFLQCSIDDIMMYVDDNIKQNFMLHT